MKNIKSTANKDEHILGKGENKGMWDQNKYPRLKEIMSELFKIQSLEIPTTILRLSVRTIF